MGSVAWGTVPAQEAVKGHGQSAASWSLIKCEMQGLRKGSGGGERGGAVSPPRRRTVRERLIEEVRT